MSQDETLDTNDVKNSSLQASNGKNVATLRAYDAIALEVRRYILLNGSRKLNSKTQTTKYYKFFISLVFVFNFSFAYVLSCC